MTDIQTDTQDDLLQQFADDGELSPEQAAQLLDLQQGDSGTAPQEAAQPEAAAEPKDEPEAKAPNDDAKPDADDASKQPSEPAEPAPDKPEASDALEETIDPANTVILAKDGKHTIEYAKLEEARSKAKQAQSERDAALAQAAAFQQQLERLQAQAAGNPEPATVTTDVPKADVPKLEEDPEVFGDFSEQGISKGVHTLMNKLYGQHSQSQQEAIEQLVQQQVEQRVGEALKPVQEYSDQTATQQHYGKILHEHPDALSVFESQELDTWIKAQPSFAQETIHNVLAGGNTQHIIEVLSTFKQATQAPKPDEVVKPVDDAATLKQQAQAAVENAANPTPVTITDIAGGRAPEQTAEERMLGLDGGVELLNAMSGMSKEQIEAYMSKHF